MLTKFKAEQAIKDFRTANPDYEIITIRPNVPSFTSDLRESLDDMKNHKYQKYVTLINCPNRNQLLQHLKEASFWMKSMHSRKVNLSLGWNSRIPPIPLGF